MWIFLMVTSALFYLLAILQNSFFVHLSLFGTIPNLVFILFFLLVFFRQKTDYVVIFSAVLSGLLLDIFSGSYFGLSILLLLIISFLAKKSQLLLKETREKYPIVHFIPLFIFWLQMYKLLNYPSQIILDWRILAEAVYNLFFAVIGFYIFKKIASIDEKNRQLKLL